MQSKLLVRRAVAGNRFERNDEMATMGKEGGWTMGDNAEKEMGGSG